MKRATTIICCISFAIGGFMISMAQKINLYTKTAQAASQPVIMQYPKDLLLGHTNNIGPTILRDTVHDTIPLEICCVGSTKTVYKTKWRTKKVFVPDTIARKAMIDVDTIHISKPTIVVPVTNADSVSL